MATGATGQLTLSPKGDSGDVPGGWPQLRVREAVPAGGAASRDRWWGDVPGWEV